MLLFWDGCAFSVHLVGELSQLIPGLLQDPQLNPFLRLSPPCSPCLQNNANFFLNVNTCITTLELHIYVCISLTPQKEQHGGVDTVETLRWSALG